MLNVCNGCTWKESLLKVLPQRKGATEKELGTDEAQEESAENNNGD